MKSAIEISTAKGKRKLLTIQDSKVVRTFPNREAARQYIRNHNGAEKQLQYTDANPKVVNVHE